jgi:hypothetical protein
MDVDAVLLSVQERDKWRHRLAVLTRSLGEIREQRGRVEARLRKIRRELDRVAAYSDAILPGGAAAHRPPSPSVHAGTEGSITPR